MNVFKKTNYLSLSFLLFSFLQTSSFLYAKTVEIAEESELAQIFTSKHDTIIMASMTYCSWCNKTKPYFIQLEAQYTSKINFYIINGPQTRLQNYLHDFTHEGKHLTKEMLEKLKKQHALGVNNTLHITGYPVFLYLKHGKIVDIFIGGCSLETLETFIKKNHK